MPLYDYIYDTVDKSSDTLYEKSLEREAEVPDVVHLTHLTTLESIYHLRIGFASLASKPHASKWYMLFMWPVTLWSIMLAWIYDYTFVVERNLFKNLKLQTWAIPKYRVQVIKLSLLKIGLHFAGLFFKGISNLTCFLISLQYFMQWQRESINNMIEKAIIEADQKGIKVLSLGLLNQASQNICLKSLIIPILIYL